MSKNKRKQYGPAFKAKVALEALRCEKSMAELANLYEVHPTMVNNWKRQLLAGASDIFERGSEHKDSQGQKEQVGGDKDPKNRSRGNGRTTGQNRPGGTHETQSSHPRTDHS